MPAPTRQTGSTSCSWTLGNAPRHRSYAVKDRLGRTITSQHQSSRLTRGACWKGGNGEDEQSQAIEQGLDPTQVFALGATEQHIYIPVEANSRVKLGLRYESGVALPNTASRFRVMAMEGDTVKGGSTYVLRH